MTEFSHLDQHGKPTMVNVSAKAATQRTARAQAVVELGRDIMERLAANELHTPKGAVFQTAIIAGIQGAKRTGELIPLCHPLGLDHCQVEIEPLDEKSVRIVCTAGLFAKTGVEMEALTGASVAALTVYDMCKALSHAIVIRDIRLLEKTGGKKDFRLTN